MRKENSLIRRIAADDQENTCMDIDVSDEYRDALCNI